MIILITGASHTGKTVLTQILIEKYSFPSLSIDHLKMGLIRSGNTMLTPEDDEELTPYLWPIVREMIKTAVENSQNLIIEGCYIPFNWREDFTDDYLIDIRFICLAFSDRYIESHYDEIKKHSSDIEKRLDDSYCTIDQLKQDNHFYIEGFQAAEEPVIVIDSNYEETICSIMEHAHIKK